MPARSFDWSTDLLGYLYLYQRKRRDEVFLDNFFRYKNQLAQRFDRILSRKIYPQPLNIVVANRYWFLHVPEKSNHIGVMYKVPKSPGSRDPKYKSHRLPGSPRQGC